MWGVGDVGVWCGVWVIVRDGGCWWRGIGVGVFYGDDGYGGV